MNRVRVKYYGLVPMTRRTYVTTTAVAGALAVSILGVALAYGWLPSFRLPWEPTEVVVGHFVVKNVYVGKPYFVIWLLNNFYTILFVLLVLEAIDFSTMLWCFRKKEAEQRARLSQGEQVTTE